MEIFSREIASCALLGYLLASPNGVSKRSDVGNTSMDDALVTADKSVNAEQRSWPRFGLALLICLYIIVCCISFRMGYPFYRESHILYDGERLHYAIPAIAAFAALAPLFVFTRFSFGYFSGFYFYSMILGYLWLNCFSQFRYNHETAGFSAAISALAFLL